MGIDDGESARTPTSPTPERSSAAATQNDTVASCVVVSKRTGLMEKSRHTGGVVSWLCPEECERETQKKVTTNTSPTFDERSARHRDLSCMEVRDMGFSIRRKVVFVLF
jgi:hypothetical protein